jgi:hypothetical protein
LKGRKVVSERASEPDEGDVVHVALEPGTGKSLDRRPLAVTGVDDAEGAEEEPLVEEEAGFAVVSALVEVAVGEGVASVEDAAVEDPVTTRDWEGDAAVVAGHELRRTGRAVAKARKKARKRITALEENIAKGVTGRRKDRKWPNSTEETQRPQGLEEESNQGAKDGSNT